MNNSTCILSLLLLFLLIGCERQIGNDTIGNAYINGQWFDGSDFNKKTLYSVDGKLRSKTPQRIDTTIDLSGKFIIPPFADAHTHNLDVEPNINEIEEQYLQEGTFYVQVLTNHTSKVDSLRGYFDRSSKLDVAYSNAGLTSTGGHPFAAFEARALNLSWRAMIYEPEKIRDSRIGEGDSYWLLDTKEDVENKWADIIATQPDLIKIFLINADKHKELVENGRLGDKGLSPEVAQLVTEKAHRSGLRVYAHVETAEDFRLGLNIGVDGFAHLPGYSWKGTGGNENYTLTDDDLEKAIEQDVVVIPTANFSKVYATQYKADGSFSLDSVKMDTVNTFLNNELYRLLKKRIRIAVGSDQIGYTTSVELDHLNKYITSLTNEKLLTIATKTTPQSIFPNRKVGELKDGYEASFLVLNCNPLDNFYCTKEIKLRIKEGYELNYKIKPQKKN
ncbi:MAG: hypothetical protein ABJR05_08060 [Balneola sp.]